MMKFLFILLLFVCACTSFRSVQVDLGEKHSRSDLWAACKELVTPYGIYEESEKNGTIISKYFKKSNNSKRFNRVFLEFQYASKRVKIKVLQFDAERNGPRVERYKFYDYDKNFGKYLLKKLKRILYIMKKERKIRSTISD